MGLKRGSSSTLALRDVADNMKAFQDLNGVFLEIRLALVDRHGAPDFRLNVLAHDASVGIGDLPPLGSVNLSCSGLNLVSLEAALIHGLYLMDFELAAREMRGKDSGASLPAR